MQSVDSYEILDKALDSLGHKNKMTFKSEFYSLKFLHLFIKLFTFIRLSEIWMTFKIIIFFK